MRVTIEKDKHYVVQLNNGLVLVGIAENDSWYDPEKRLPPPRLRLGKQVMTINPRAVAAYWEDDSIPWGMYSQKKFLELVREDRE